MKYSLIKLIKNLRLLMSEDLRAVKENIIYDTMQCVEDYDKYMRNDSRAMFGLNILNYDETVDLLLNKPRSFCRFGDGEIDLIQGKSIPFQRFNKVLADEMRYILETDIPNLYVGINYNYFNSIDNLNDTNKRFYIANATRYRRFFEQICNKQRTYIAAAFNQLYMFLKDYNYKKYYDKIKSLFKDKDLVVFAGSGLLEEMKYDVFELAKSKQIIPCPKKDAFSEYEKLMGSADNCSKDQIICLMIGPTSKVMAYHLSQCGHIAWDVGHMAKDYNAYMMNVPKDVNKIYEFYAPEK